MFDSIVFKNSYSHDQKIDVGALAESLIFYGKVKIVGNQGTLKYLLRKIPPAIFLDLIERDIIEFHFLSDNLAVHIRNVSETRNHYSLATLQDSKTTYNEHAFTTFKDAASSSPQAKTMAYKFEKKLHQLDHGSFNQNALLKKWENSEAVESSISTILDYLAPQYIQKDKLRFRIEYPSTGGFFIDTNIDPLLLSRTYRLPLPMKQGVPISVLLSQLQYSYESSFFSASLDSELFVDPYEQEMQKKTLQGLWARDNEPQKEVNDFVDLTLDNCNTIREAVNSGRVSFYEVVKVINSSKAFKRWIQGVPPEKTLMQEFYKETIKDSALSKLPAKTSKWILFTGTSLALGSVLSGGIATTAALTMGVIDTFLADKIIGGWKPHQFVEGSLKSTFGKK